MGKPDNLEDYLAIEVGEWARYYGTIYVPWEIWKGLRPVSQEFVFYIPEYGRFRLDFDVPIRWLKGLPGGYERCDDQTVSGSEG